MEKVAYELRPYFYVVLSVWTFLKLNNSMLAKASAGALMVSAFFVLYMRFKFRRRYGR